MGLLGRSLGLLGKAALEKLGAWSGLRGKLAETENVRAALALVARGEAPLGIVYQTDAKADTGHQQQHAGRGRRAATRLDQQHSQRQGRQKQDF